MNPPHSEKPISSRYEGLAILLVALASVSFVVALNLTPVFNSDVWIQLKVGDVIRESGQIPETLEYTFTEAKDNAFVAHEWLASLLWSHLYAQGGYNGMIVAKCSLAAIVFALSVLLTLQVGRHLSFALALGVLTMLGINFRCLLRPEIIGFVLVLVNLNLLYAFVRRGNPVWLLALIPTSVLWANSHGSFLVNLALPIFFASGAVADAWWARKRRSEELDFEALRKHVGWLVFAWIGMIGASLINPYGVHLFDQVFEHTNLDYIRANIFEWQSPFHERFHREPFLFIFGTIAALTAFSAVTGRKGLRATPLFLVLVFFGQALSVMRYIPWFEIMGAFFVAHHLSVPSVPRQWRLSGAVLAALVLFLGTAFVMKNGNTLGHRPGFWNRAPLNPLAIQFIRDSEISGNVFHSYKYGDQLAYHFYPLIRMTMDTRANSYGEEHYTQFRRLSGGNPTLQGESSELEEFLEKYDVRAIVTKPLNVAVWQTMGHSEVLVRLGFSTAYHDPTTVILTR